jgi:hypothetical protein
MIDIKEMAKKWAQSNSSPGDEGADALYEITIEIQEQAYEAGFKSGMAISGNYIANDAVEPRRFAFANGRVVESDSILRLVVGEELTL